MIKAICPTTMKANYILTKKQEAMPPVQCTVYIILYPVSAGFNYFSQNKKIGWLNN